MLSIYRWHTCLWQNLKQVFQRLQQAGLKLKPSKCALFKKEVLFLGYRVSGFGVQTDPQKIAVIANWPVPTDPTEVQSLLGLCSYHRRFKAGFSSIAKPLFRLSEKGRVFKWTTKCNEAFEKLKCHLVSTPILDHPDLVTFCSWYRRKSCRDLSSHISKNWWSYGVISYASKTLSKSERKCCVTRKELLAVVYACQHFRHFLYGHKAIFRTDHSPLKWLISFNDQQG